MIGDGHVLLLPLCDETTTVSVHLDQRGLEGVVEIFLFGSTGGREGGIDPQDRFGRGVTLVKSGRGFILVVDLKSLVENATRECG
jgi:hypothetical protein